ncbi:D-tyrosyl-tRNA(Tyr) deacylase [bacterium]|nr:MAG: D-tyrosyl-tRNA(Tyr) deacylase [bacterium]
MRVVLQRVLSAHVQVEGRTTGRIERGLLLLCAFRVDDTNAQLEWMARKICELRIFQDDAGKMNRSVADIDGGLLIVSQFTLFGDVRKGRRPSFVGSAPGPIALELYESFVSILESSGLPVQTGEFAADMQVELVNDGPVTLILDRDVGA